MNTSPLELTHEMQAEIERHKYFLSEKAGFDVGWEAAEKDWMENFGPKVEPQTELDSEPPSGSAKGVGGFFKRLLNKAK